MAMVDESWSSASTEARRQAIVGSYPSDQPEITVQLDRLAALAARLCDAPVGLVSLIETDLQRFIGRHGTGLSETPREHAFCDIAMHEANGLFVRDAREDARFRDNPLVTGPPAIRFYAGHSLRSAEGAPLGALCVIDDAPHAALTSEQWNGLRTLADAAMALLERWRLENDSRRQAARSQSAINDLEHRFHVLTDAMPQMVWSARPSGSVDYVNQRWLDFTGGHLSDSLGDSWMQFLHPDDCDLTAHAWQQAVASGGVYEVEYRLRRCDGEHRWILARGLPITDESGAITRWVGTSTDLHEQKLAAEQHELLTRELNHRIKNIFAVVGGLIALSQRRYPELADLGATLQQRVLALGRAHDLVRPHHDRSRAPAEHAGLKGMLNKLLDAYQTLDKERILIAGEDVAIDDRSATPLALFFHELATNAAKYGALSTSQGQVEIRIAKNEDIELLWVERGGPPPAATIERGFGASLIDMSITRQLGGTLDYDWRKDGLTVTARVPARMMAR